MDAERIGFLFPGQGAQAPGMGREICERSAAARELFSRASEVLGYDLAQLCFEGPEEKLNATEYSQPALFVTSLAAVEALRDEHPEWLERAVAAAGLSLGEYTAVCFAGGLSFEDGLRLVQRRGQAMQAAADQVSSGMSSVIGLELAQVEQLCEETRQADEVLVPANLLCPGNIAVSGHLTALRRMEEPAKEMGARMVVPLAVAGAFHTSLMEPAVDALREALAAAAPVDTRLPVYSNVDASPHTEAAIIRDLLTRQVVNQVRWEDSLRRMVADGVSGFLEVGAGRVLCGTMKRIDRKFPCDSYGQ